MPKELVYAPGFKEAVVFRKNELGDASELAPHPSPHFSAKLGSVFVDERDQFLLLRVGEIGEKDTRTGEVGIEPHFRDGNHLSAVALLGLETEDLAEFFLDETSHFGRPESIHGIVMLVFIGQR